MAKANKFGAFSGVFTPSILTILGVIMYLRLGWVVGQGGLILTLVIISVAHIISVSTGLSISSIATDKKIKTGGIYYILSRSLGMAMGGSIGIALFIGTALSISLYIVGFTENFLSIPAISKFLGMQGSINDIRIVGTVVIISLVVLAFISTAVVIKTQYFILAAIFLSLISIVWGFFSGTSTGDSNILWSPMPEHLPFEYLFAVFFPAVTGFTAGVAMSGDLKNPNKDIPRGTLAAIIVGFVVYILLAIGVAAFVERDILINDSNFLMHIARFSPFVVAGIWGATLSSALGGILGGPRILQAIAQDKILPSFLGKGFGVNNEPRNALLFIFAIAEMGILVGDLNMIAGIVSMFYLASYGFINLAFALESFAGADFRPTFRISKWVGVIGFVASFAVMFKLDATAMSLALLIMVGIYILLKRKEMRSDFGDVWTSVWNSVARSALYKMDKNKIEDRNWQPNIILFSGSSSKRQYLVDFGKSLVGKFGVLSNFDLIENPSADYLFPKHKQSLSEGAKEVGIFYRRQTCKDIYQGIEMIASTYGFSGMEPNTVLMGWAKQSSEPEKFVRLIKSLNQLDLNVLLMDYDKHRGFGKKSSIDIWWRGEGQNNNLALFLAKFLMSSPEWENAKLRLISISQFEQQGEMLYRKARYVLDALRIEADVHVINNQYNKQSVYDIIKEESLNTDLVFMGLPDIYPGKEESFVRQTNRLLGLIGTVVLVKASTLFRKMIFIPDDLVKIPKLKPEPTVLKEKSSFEQITTKYKLKPEIANELKQLFFELKNLASFISVNYVKSVTGNFAEILSQHINTINNLADIENKVYTPDEIITKLLKIEQNTAHIIDELYKISNSGKEIQERAITQYQNGINKLIAGKKTKIILYFKRNEIVNLPDNKNSLKRIKHKLEWKSKFTGKAKLVINYKKILENQLIFHSNIEFYTYLASLFSLFFDVLTGIKDLFRKTQFLLPAINELPAKHLEISLQKNKLKEFIDGIEEINKQKKIVISYPDNHLYFLYSKIIGNLAALFEKPDVNLLGNLNAKQRHVIETVNERLYLLSDFWNTGFHYFLNELKLDNILSTISLKLYKIIVNLRQELLQVLDLSFQEQIQILSENHQQVQEFLKNKKKKKIELKTLKISDNESITLLLNEIKEQVIEDIKQLYQNIPETGIITDNFSMAGLFSSEHFIRKQKIPTKHLIEEIITNDVIAGIYRLFDLLDNKAVEFNNKILNYNRLINISIDENFENLSPDDLSVTDNILENKQQTIQMLKLSLNDLSVKIQNSLDNSYLNIEHKFQLFSFKKEAQTHGQTISTVKNIRFFIIRKYLDKFKAVIDKQIERFWHEQSKISLLDNFLKKQDNKINFNAGDIAHYVQSPSLNNKLQEQLPFYYRYLFLNKEFFNKDFWFHRTDELLKAKEYVNNFQKGIHGALIIKGAPYSGKSFFIHKFIENFAGNYKVYRIIAQREKNINKKTLNGFLQKTTDITGDSVKILNKIPKGSIIVFDNLELWWQKSPTGNIIINQLIDLIKQFGNTHIFILSIDIDAYHMIYRTSKIASITAKIINMEPFTAKQLQEAILYRHNSSGIKFILEESAKFQDELKAKELAHIFYQYFLLSKGNIGFALNYWIANIIGFDGNYLKIKIPKPINNQALNSLNTDCQLILSQFLFHKYLSKDNLSDILNIKQINFTDDFDYLLRTGILQKKIAGLYHINPAIYLPIREKLIEKEYIAV
ncbi:MAG: hypothetical protein L3J74_05250 [Bacteroidales bacterium]|nr:hypothetical protein [Bacteroidales bacterium]